MRDLLTLDDSMGRSTPAAVVSDCRLVLALAAGAAKSLPVPAEARCMMISSTADVWVQYGAAATLPVGDDLSGAAPELNPAVRAVDGVASLGFVSSSGCLVSLVFYG